MTNPSSPSTSHRSILFVEDRILNFRWIKEFLQEQRWRVEIVATPQEARRYLDDCESFNRPLPTVISIDLGLATKPEEPDFGIELLEEIRRRWDGLPLVIHGMNVRVQRDVVRRIVAQGASYFFLATEEVRLQGIVE